MVFWKKKKTEKNQDDDVTLTDIIRGLQYCVNSSRQISTRQEIEGFNEFIDSENTPYYRTVKINDQAAMDIPLICMFNHNTLGLEEMEVSLELVVKNIALKVPEQVVKSVIPLSKKDQSEGQEQVENTEGLSRSSFSVDLDSAKLDGKHTRLGLKLKFKSGDPSEAISRVIEKLNGQIIAYSLEKKKEDD